MTISVMNIDGTANSTVHSIFESGATSDPLDEIMALIREIAPCLDLMVLRHAHEYTANLFAENSSGEHEVIVSYHNMRHTYSVVLAAARLFHGLYHEKTAFSEGLILQGLLSTYFHDIGLLYQANCQETGERGSRHHEGRSVAVLEEYLKENDLPREYVRNCASIIHCTSLNWCPRSNGRSLDDLELCGQVVATADILAQMADRYYVENLPLLFDEQIQYGICEHESALELMRETASFHENIVKRRLETSLGNLSLSMRTHFRRRWNIDSNLYLDNINLNLKYLGKISKHCGCDFECWKQYLRRNPPEADHFCRGSLPVSNISKTS